MLAENTKKKTFWGTLQFSKFDWYCTGKLQTPSPVTPGFPPNWEKIPWVSQIKFLNFLRFQYVIIFLLCLHLHVFNQRQLFFTVNHVFWIVRDGQTVTFSVKFFLVSYKLFRQQGRENGGFGVSPKVKKFFENFNVKKIVKFKIVFEETLHIPRFSRNPYYMSG